MMSKDVIIIGAGPAGLATAVQLKRYGIEALWFEKKSLGGLLHNANLVENYPGFPGGISGPDLIKLFDRQSKQISVRPKIEEVLNLDRKDDVFVVETNENRYAARVVVVASGTKPVRFEQLDIPQTLIDRVFYEVYPLLHKKGSTVAIAGAGDAAFDYGLNLSKNNHVIIINRGIERKCLPLLWERTADNPNIRYLENTTIQRLLDDREYGMLLECSKPEDGMNVRASYLIGALGRVQQLDFLSDRVAEQKETLQAGGHIYFVGDVKNNIYRQTSIAVGDGVKAAMQIFRNRAGEVE